MESFQTQEKKLSIEKIEALKALVEGEPEAFFILVGAMKYNEKKERYESGSFADADENSLLSTGVNLATGGKDRMLAAVEMHTAFPDALIIPMSRTRDETKPTYAKVTESELIKKGVAPTSIELEENSVSTITEFLEAAKLWEQHRWKNIVFISSDWHLTRAEALYNHIENFPEGDELVIVQKFIAAITAGDILVQFLSSTEVLSIKDRRYAQLFEAVENDEGMKARMIAELRALEMIREGKYGQKEIPKKIWQDSL